MIFQTQFISPNGIKFYPHVINICNDTWSSIENSCLKVYGLYKKDICKNSIDVVCPFVFSEINWAGVKPLMEAMKFAGFNIYDVSRGEFFYSNDKLVLDFICVNYLDEKEICRNKQL